MTSPSTTNGHPTTGASTAEPKPASTDIDLDAPEQYLNRELTWLTFVKRVLHEADDDRTPLLERVKFIAITGSILDEFFMKRIGGLKQQVAAGVHKLTVDGRTPIQQIKESHELIRALTTEQQGCSCRESLLTSGYRSRPMSLSPRPIRAGFETITSRTSFPWSRRRRWTRRIRSRSFRISH